MSAKLVLVEMEELAPTVQAVIHADAKLDGQAIIVPKVRLSIDTLLNHIVPNKRPWPYRYKRLPFLLNLFFSLFPKEVCVSKTVVFNDFFCIFLHRLKYYWLKYY